MSPSSRPRRSSVTTRLAAGLGATGVVLGAFGAHALRSRVTPDLLEVYKTGVLYHLVHAVALLGLASAVDRLRWPRVTLGLFVGGIAVFSGSLYLLAITGMRALGAITPLGGLSLIAAWVTVGFVRESPQQSP